MDHSFVVRRLQPGANFACNFGGFGGRQSADPSQQGREVFAVDILHRKERNSIDLADVIHSAYVWMGDLAGHPDFALEPFEQAIVFGSSFGQKLKGDGLAQCKIGGPVDLPYPALAEQGSGDEAPFFRGATPNS